MSASPFEYDDYPQDIAELDQCHPIALYRRLAEPTVRRRDVTRETRAWSDCMDKWGEELGAREKTEVSFYVLLPTHTPSL